MEGSIFSLDDGHKRQRKQVVSRRVITGSVVSVGLLALLVVWMTPSAPENNQGTDTVIRRRLQEVTIFSQSGYKIDNLAPDFGVAGQKVDLQMNNLIRDGARMGTGYTVKFGQVLDSMRRDVCAYAPKTIYSSWGVVNVEQNSSAWNPKSQSQLFLPNDDSVLLPFTANPDAVLEVSRAPDFNSLMQFNDKLYMAVHHEQPRPSEVSFLEIAQSDSGLFSVVSTRRVDFSEYNGTWNPCAGSMTPWGTHLGSQEYDPDARLLVECDTLDCMTDLKDHDSQSIQYFMRYYGYYLSDVLCYFDQRNLTMSDVKQNFNPYMYGHIPEIGVDANGDPTVGLWFTLGRFSHEAAVIVGDNKTVYLTDDGTNNGFYKFVADTPSDLSSGCIFGAKVQQNADQTFALSWIQLGCGSNGEIEQIARSGIKFDDIFSYVDADDSGDGPICPDGFTATNVGHTRRLECLQLIPGQEMAAAFLETRRMLAINYGTTEFSKMEGITYDAKRNRVYASVSEIRYGMEDNQRKGEPETKYDMVSNDIRLTYNPCGCVYYADLDAAFSATNLVPLICGRLNDPSNTDAGCQINNIAGPDNVAMAGPDAVFIAEDTDAHENNFLWMFDLDTSVLTRVASCMYGAEVTGPYYHPSVQGSSYIFYVCQHPYEESNRDKVVDPTATGQAGWLNYLGPLPVLGETESMFCENIEAPTGDAQHQSQATTACYAGTRIQQ
eukprot:TRINITY_DN290_c0_g1_i10.p1 TRINITY_DN290_c0_g1~~TRINITY_DN290_c0_g1_i10.p1  ORF type:complete len:718 (-),score=160.74 TRINITY_DN290_c0_g1_i10:514-2667(-)